MDDTHWGKSRSAKLKAKPKQQSKAVKKSEPLKRKVEAVSQGEQSSERTETTE